MAQVRCQHRGLTSSRRCFINPNFSARTPDAVPGSVTVRLDIRTVPRAPGGLVGYPRATTINFVGPILTECTFS